MDIKRLVTKLNQSGRYLNAVGGIQHSTGNGEDEVIGNFEYFNNQKVGANAHFFIDDTGVYQFVETNQQAYHALYPANGNKWGCEMCETYHPVKFKKIWNLQVELWVYLFTEVASPKIIVINQDTLRGHFEENDINHPTYSEAHQDPRSYFNRFGKTMGDMRTDVQKAINKKLNPIEIKKVEVKKVEEWKIQIVKDAFAQGLITDVDGWIEKADEAAPVWMVLKVIMNKK